MKCTQLVGAVCVQALNVSGVCAGMGVIAGTSGYDVTALCGYTHGTSSTGCSGHYFTNPAYGTAIATVASSVMSVINANVGCTPVTC
jgi:hypothetical protein